MNSRECKTYLVIGCKRDAGTTWEPIHMHGTEVPVCWFHFRRRLLWYRGAVYDHTEEAE
jgi:hypothetical protein